MSWYLQGPFPFDPGGAQSSGRAALTAAEALLLDRRVDLLRPASAVPAEPGLYLLWTDAPELAVAGFWLVFGPTWLEFGPAGPPDQEPPYARALLTAATEEVWWQNLAVWPRQGGTWRPLVVLEWASPLAWRAALPPQGVPARRELDEDEEAGETGGWLDPVGRMERSGPILRARVEEEPEGAEHVAGLPMERSIVALVAGELTWDRRVHRGQLALVSPTVFPAPPPGELLPLDAWVGRAVVPGPAPAGDTHTLGPALELPGGRAGFPLSGWLTRSLTVWPAHPSEVRAGSLVERDVQSPWRAQARTALTVTAGVLVLVFGLAGLVFVAAQPRLRAAPTVPPPSAQPAMSVCSADHQQFVEEFRCQIAHAAKGGNIDQPVCGDADSPEHTVHTDDDLQAAFCGELDRELDGWKAGRAGNNFAELAASQACFNVLGHPYPYLAAGYNGSGRKTGDPALFLRDPNLSIRALGELVNDLTSVCGVYRDRVESQVSGAVFATHVGARPRPDVADTSQSEPARLRQSLLTVATAGLPADASRCFTAGADEGLDVAGTYSGLCGGPDDRDASFAEHKAWKVLAGSVAEADPVIARYAAARFGTADQTSLPLWKCDLQLSGRAPPTGPDHTGVLWDLTAPVPHRYSIDSGAIGSQLLLDATLRSIEAGNSAGQCWDVVSRQLSRYTPVHPLLSDPAADGWPSPEQQLCGQICAVSYHVKHGDNQARWVTPGSDMDLCLESGAPTQEPEFGKGRLDSLRLPWNGGERGAWITPSPAQICGFNLVAQGYLPTAPKSVIADGLAPPLWAGETAPGSRLAGGVTGAAASAALSLSSYGRTRSTSTCGYVATQCFVSGLLDILGDPRSEPYEWMDHWNRWVQGLPTARNTDLAAAQPWCALIQSHLDLDQKQAEGQLDYPCTKGISDTEQNVEGFLQTLASGSYGGGTK